MKFTLFVLGLSTLVILLAVLAGCGPGMNAVGTGFGMASGYQPYQPYSAFQPQPQFQTHMQSCVMQQDPFGGAVRMRCY